MALHYRNILTGTSGALLVGGQAGMVAVAGLWAVGTTIGLAEPILLALYAIGITLGLWVMALFARLAHRTEPFWSVSAMKSSLGGVPLVVDEPAGQATSLMCSSSDLRPKR